MKTHDREDGLAEFCFLLYSEEEGRDAGPPRSARPPVNGKMFSLAHTVNLIPPHILREMLEEFFAKYGLITHNPVMCTPDDLPEILDRMRYYELD